VAIADGVAGGPGGGIASTTAIQAVREALRHPSGEADDLVAALSQAGAALFGVSLMDDRLRSMATTLDVALLGEPAAQTTAPAAHVGDGAVWLPARNTPPRLLTRTHRAASGALTHAVGAGMRVHCDIWQVVIRMGDRLVLATDGFHGQLPPDIALRQLEDTRRMSAMDAAAALVRAALGGGGGDNISVVVVDLVSAGNAGPDERRPERGRWPDGPTGPGGSSNAVRY